MALTGRKRTVWSAPKGEAMTTDTRELGWTSQRLTGDYVRGVLGVLFALFCIVLAPPGSWWQFLLIGLLVLFSVFLGDVMIRHGTRIRLSPEGLMRRKPFLGETVVSWSEIQGLDVRFFASRRDRTAGWMTAKVTGPAGTISLDDSMIGFEDVMDRAMQALEARGLGMNEATAANLASLGLDLRPKAPK
jgi:hypothetical protein